MPLVTITCKDPYYPTDTPVRDSFPSLESMNIIELARTLPDMIIDRKEALGLEADTTAGAVQVDIKKFHTYAVNAVDIWVHIWFTEVKLSKKELAKLKKHGVSLEDIREVLTGMLINWFAWHELNCKVALDVFFGPGTGFIVDLSQKDPEPIVW